MRSNTPTVKDDKKSRFLVLWTVVWSNNIIRLYMSYTCYMKILDPFGGDLTLVWPFLGGESLTWAIFGVSLLFSGPNHAKFWSWPGIEALEAAMWSEICTMCISKRSRSLVWHIVAWSDVTIMLPMMCRVPLVILEWFWAHLICVWPFGHFAVPRAVF